MPEILPLQFQPTVPLTTSGINVGQLMQARGLASEIALRNAQAQNLAQETQKNATEAADKQRLLAGENDLQSLYKDPKNAYAFGQGNFGAAMGVVPPDVIAKHQQIVQAAITAKATSDKQSIENEQNSNKQVAKTLQGFTDPNYDEKNLANDFPQAFERLQSEGFLSHMDQSALAQLQQNPPTTKEQIMGLASKLGVSQGIIDAAAELKKEQATTSASNATARKETAEADKQEMLNTMLRNAQQGIQNGQHPIDSILPASVDPAANSSYKHAYDTALAGGGPDAAKPILEAAARHATELSPATRANKAQTSHDEAAAAEGVHIDQSLKIQRALNGTGAVGNVPPHLVPAATTAYNKSGEALAAAQTSSDEIQKVLDMASAGNKAAGANVPMMGVGAVNAVNGIKRINSAEIAQYGTAGSLIDKIQGKLQGWTEGQPIPADVLNDMKALHAQLAEGAQTKHAREVQSINQTYGSTFQPMKMEPAKQAMPTSGGAYKAGDTRVINGKTYTRDTSGNWNPK